MCQLTDLLSIYQELHRVPKSAFAARGQRFNSFLAELLRRDGLDARSDQRSLGDWDEIDVHFTHAHTPYILEAKWTAVRTNRDPILKIEGRLKTRPPGVRAVLVSMSGYTKQALEQARSDAGVLLLDRAHVEALVSGLLSAQQLLDSLLSTTSLRGGSYAPLSDLLPTYFPPTEPPPRLRSSTEPFVGFPAHPIDGVTITSIATAEGSWSAGETNGLAVDAAGKTLWTLPSGVLRVDPHTGTSAWTSMPPDCVGPVLASPDGAITFIANGAAVRMDPDNVATIIGGGFTPRAHLVAGPGDQQWVFASSGPRTREGFGGHSLGQLGGVLHEQVAFDVDFSGQVHQAILTGAGSLYLAGGGSSVTTIRERNWGCPPERWFNSAPLRPVTSLAVGEHTVLLAGHTPHGVEKALFAVDTRDHNATLLVRFPNTTHIVGLAHAGNSSVYLLTDIRGNDPTPRPLLLRIVLPDLP